MTSSYLEAIFLQMSEMLDLSEVVITEHLLCILAECPECGEGETQNLVPNFQGITVK